MSNLKIKNPILASYLEIWNQKYGQKNFNFTTEKDQTDFVEGIKELATHIAHISNNASIKIVIGDKGLTAAFVNVTPKH